MRLALTACTLAALCGTTATAQPVARHLVDDADRVETLYAAQTLSNIGIYASLLVLDDLNGDGAAEVLLTHALESPTSNDFFRAVVRDTAANQELLTLPPDAHPAAKLAHTAALMTDDINSDGIRDIAVGRAFASRSVIRVHSGANGEVLAQPFAPRDTAWGLSMLPITDAGDILVGRFDDGDNSAAFIVWNPATGFPAAITPLWYPSRPNTATGYTLLDMGLGTSGARRFLATRCSRDFAALEGLVDLFGGIPVVYESFVNPRKFNAANDSTRVFAGAAKLGDLDGDGFPEFVATGRYTDAAIPGLQGQPVFSGAEPARNEPVETETPIRVHPSAFRLQNTPHPEPNFVGDLAMTTVGDITADGFPDYAVAGFVPAGPELRREIIVVVCGRTGQAVCAYAAGDPATGSVVDRLTASRSGIDDLRRDSFVSPGDL
ncbi:MAG: hypothetical protein ACTS27_12960, partial [Phycisphaerales bacterium]